MAGILRHFRKSLRRDECVVGLGGLELCDQARSGVERVSNEGDLARDSRKDTQGADAGRLIVDNPAPIAQVRVRWCGEAPP